VESVLWLSKRSVFSTARIRLRSAAAVGVDSPCQDSTAQDASQFVSDCDNIFVARSTLGNPAHPLPEPSGVALDAKQYRASTVDQHATQIDVATFADAEHLLLAPGGVLPWHDGIWVNGSELKRGEDDGVIGTDASVLSILWE
jgi:hypothetical protein